MNIMLVLNYIHTWCGTGSGLTLLLDKSGETIVGETGALLIQGDCQCDDLLVLKGRRVEEEFEVYRK